MARKTIATMRRPGPYRISPEQEAIVLSLLREGHGRNAVARFTDVSNGAVTSIARSYGLDLVRTRHEMLAGLRAAAADFDLKRRLELHNVLSARLEELAAAEDLTPSQLQALAITLGILTDKRRLDTGEATERTEASTVHVYLPAKGSIATIDAQLVRPQLPAPTDAPLPSAQSRAPQTHLLIGRDTQPEHEPEANNAPPAGAEPPVLERAGTDTAQEAGQRRGEGEQQAGGGG